ncbi:hypothetical protein [Streptomyces sp. CB02261]|uniref:hypothetical protein n=1 Tax=Streptomyces sp. CB02261 TaxID=1703940 RepID=UPI00093B44DA
MFIPQSHVPGAEAEVDFGEVHIVLAGVPTRCYLFSFRLSYAHEKGGVEGQVGYFRRNDFVPVPVPPARSSTSPHGTSSASSAPKAAKSPLGTSTTQESHQQITQAGAFLVWLAARHVTLEFCTQTDLDAWHAETYSTRRPAQAFLRWCMETRRMPRLTIPNRPTTNPHPMG